MPTTPDRHPGESDEEGILLEVAVADPTVVGGIRYVTTAFRLKDAIGVYDPRTVHLIASDWTPSLLLLGG